MIADVWAICCWVRSSRGQRHRQHAFESVDPSLAHLRRYDREIEWVPPRRHRLAQMVGGSQIDFQDPISMTGQVLFEVMYGGAMGIQHQHPPALFDKSDHSGNGVKSFA